MDIRAEIDGGIQVDIEMQTTCNEYFFNRLLLYWSRMYIKTMGKGEDYKKLKKCIVIVFVNYEMKELKDLPLHTKWQIRECKYGKKVLTDVLELNIIEVSKVRENNEKEDIIRWVKFLEDPYGMEVDKMAKTDKEIAEARRKLDEINADEELVAILEAQDFARWDYNTAILVATEKGEKERNEKTGYRNGMQKRPRTAVK